MKRTIALLLLWALLIPMAGLGTASASQRETNEKIVFEWLTEHMGLPEAAACGAMASMIEESGFLPYAENPRSAAFGICQWYADRRTSLENYCSRRGLDYRSLSAQLLYLEHELNDLSYFKDLKEALYAIENTADGAYEAGYLWSRHYEGARRHAEGRAISSRDNFWPRYAPIVVPEEQPFPQSIPDAAAELSPVSVYNGVASLTANAKEEGLLLFLEALDENGELLDYRLTVLQSGEQTLTFAVPQETASCVTCCLYLDPLPEPGPFGFLLWLLELLHAA